MFDPPISAPETILVVNGDASVLADVSLTLTNGGLTVLSAATPEEALAISLEFQGTIHLLVTAVQFPEMSGSDLANKLMAKRKTLRVIMLSGYSNGELLLLNYGWQMVKKPSVGRVLWEKVTGVLHGPDRSQGTDQFDTRKDME